MIDDQELFARTQPKPILNRGILWVLAFISFFWGGVALLIWWRW